MALREEEEHRLSLNIRTERADLIGCGGRTAPAGQQTATLCLLRALEILKMGSFHHLPQSC